MHEVLIALAYVVIVAGVLGCFAYLRWTGSGGRQPPLWWSRFAGGRSPTRSGAPSLAAVSSQGPDFEMQSYGRLDARQTVELFKSLPWREDFRTFEELESSGGEGCPPNLSVSVGDHGRLLVVACTGEDSFWVDVDPRSGRKEVDGLHASEVEEILEAHFARG